MKDPEARAGELFLEAIDLAPDERERFLEGVGAEDSWLYERVKQLLDADGSTHVQQLDSRSGLGSWAAGFLDGDSSDWDRDPERLGPFRVLRRLGVGGMGIVYEALQENPERAVALKILHPRGIRPETAKRFELEARVLGWLNHPGIAQIYSAGTSTSGGREIPYFAMELVDGEPLHRYLARANPDRSSRIELIAEIADAVHHAHQKGVVHRDLKPSNILVTEAGRPKVLDFGVARLTDSDLQRSTLSTHAGEILGTISYMSPEQVRGDVEAVDTRSDVYALGVILYEVLTGELPHKLRGVSLPKAVRALEEEEPTKPSVHDSRLAGDLETIVLEALAKEPDRRYASAEEFSSDLRRFLQHEPIVARTPSLAYQLLRFSQRHRGAALASALLFLVVLGSAILSTILLVQAREAEAEAISASERASEEADSARRVADLMVGLFEDADPEAPGGVSAQDLLDRGAERLESGEDLNPEIRAELSDAIGRSYRGLASFDRAERWVREGLTLRQELYPESSHPGGHPDLYRSLANMGSLEVAMSDHEPALTKLREAEVMLIGLAGPFGPGSAPLAGEYEVARATPDPTSELGFKDWLIVQDMLATAEVNAGQRQEAMDRVARALELISSWRESPEWTERATFSHRSLTEMAAFIEMSSGDPEAAEVRLRGMVADFDLGEGQNLARASHLMDLGKAVELQGRGEEAVAHYEEARAIYLAIVGDKHPLLANSGLRMADAFFALGRSDEAEREYREALAIFKESMSTQSAGVATCLAHLSDLLGEEGRYEEFIEVREQVLEIDIAIYGEESSRVLADLSDLAFYNANLGRLDESVALHERRCELAKKVYGEISSDVAFSLSSIAEFESARGNAERSKELFVQSLEIHGQLEGEDADPEAHMGVLAGYGWFLHEQEDYEAAVEPLSQGLEMTLATEEPAMENLVTQRMALGISLFEVGRMEEAGPHLREAKSICDELVGPDHPFTIKLGEYVEQLESDRE